MSSYADLMAGTPVEWSTTGGKLITLTSLANAAGRQGAKSATLVDGTKGLPELLEILFQSAVTSAAANGKAIELYIGESDDATAGNANPGGLSGADGAWTNAGELRPQLNFVGALILSNATGTSVQVARFKYWLPATAYISPAVYNDSGVALSGTAGNHKIVVTPYYRRAQV
jgi:hypothetical protein